MLKAEEKKADHLMKPASNSRYRVATTNGSFYSNISRAKPIEPDVALVNNDVSPALRTPERWNSIT
jgi:hypothetical protein